MSILLVCEGSPDSLDTRVLNQIVAQKLQCDVEVLAAGGDSSLRSVREYLRCRYGGRVLAIEDRDFRSAREAEQSWQNPRTVQLIWRRHEIENYLLDPRVVCEAFAQFRRSHVRGAEQLPLEPPAVFSILKDCASQAAQHYAGWAVYWMMNKAKNTNDCDLRFRRPDPEPANLASWLTYLRGESSRLCSACGAVLAAPEFTADAIAERLEVEFARLQTPDFLDSGQFLIDLEGKRLLAALAAYLSANGLPRLTRADLTTELVDALDRVYSPGFFQPDDFAELAQRLC